MFNRKSLAGAVLFVGLAASIAACKPEDVNISDSTAKDIACSAARAGNAGGQVSDDMRRKLAGAIADSVNDGTVQKIAERVRDSDTPTELREQYDQLINRACGDAGQLGDESSAE